jgi:hypothetical protein
MYCLYDAAIRGEPFRECISLFGRSDDLYFRHLVLYWLLGFDYTCLLLLLD